MSIDESVEIERAREQIRALVAEIADAVEIGDRSTAMAGSDLINFGRTLRAMDMQAQAKPRRLSPRCLEQRL